MDPLTANLLDLLHELREHPIPLTIGGGFGLYTAVYEMALLFAPPGAVLGPGRLLTPEMARHQLFADALDNAIWAETQTCLANRELNSRAAPRRGN